jgi:hypothetical protein
VAHAHLTVCLASLDPSLEVRLHRVLAPYEMAGGRDGKWDSWVIDGDDGDRGLRVLAGWEDDPRLIRNATDGRGAKRIIERGRCDGGPIEILDLEFDRLRVAEKAAKVWDEWNGLAQRYPVAQPMSYFLERLNKDSATYAQRAAWEEYVAQPIIRALVDRGKFYAERVVWNMSNDPVSQLGYDKQEYVRRRVSRAIPTGALIQTDGVWVDDMAFGDGFDYSRWDRYYAFADDYIHGLADGSTIVRLRFHS